jgi:tetratricopeptide (TPR) repeat protein
MPALLLVIATLAVVSSPSEEFERGKNAFARGQYQRAISILRPLLYPESRLETEGEVVQAHRMLGVAHLFEKQPEQASREFRKLLELRPDYRFDPLLDPPGVVEFFNQIVKEEEGEIAALEAKRKKREAELAARRQREADRLRAERAVVIRYRKNSFALNFIPFGAGQFQNGDRRKGWIFLATESVLGAASVGAFVTNLALFGLTTPRRCVEPQTIDTATGLSQRCPEDKVDPSDENLSTNLLRVQLVTGGLFYAVAVWGIIDAIRNFRDEVRIDPDPATTETANRSAAVRRTGFRPFAFAFPPGAGPGSLPSVGGGLAWSF